LKDPRKRRQSVEGLEEFFNGAACFGGGSGGLCPLEGVFLKDPRKRRQSVEGLEEFFNGLLQR